MTTTMILRGSAVAMVVLALSGCGNSSSTHPRNSANRAPSAVAALIPKVTSSIADGAVGISPAQPVTAWVTHGRIVNAALLNQDNEPVPGAISADGSTWQSTDRIHFDRSYHLRVDAIGLGGATSTTVNFSTVVPGDFARPWAVVNDGEVVGIGQPVAVSFDDTIIDRRAAQDAIKIVTDPPAEGAFYWVNNHEVHWRPAKYWAQGTKVKVDVNTYGRNLGGALYGQDDLHESYTVGDSLIFTADDNTKQVTVTRNGQVIRTMPTSMGKPSTPTPNGIYIVGNRTPHIIMDSSSFGVPANSPGGYRVPVEWDTQLAYNGIYMHSAPWSVWAQGSLDTSHGCLNLSPDNAMWVEQNAKRGDIAVVMNTSGPVLDGTDGLGDWNMPWEQWKAGNAGPAVN